MSSQHRGIGGKKGSPIRITSVRSLVVAKWEVIIPFGAIDLWPPIAICSSEQRVSGGPQDGKDKEYRKDILHRSNLTPLPGDCLTTVPIDVKESERYRI